jgi:hypothetical protein
VNFAALLVLGPLAVAAPLSANDAIEREMVADHAQIAEHQHCLMAEHRMRTRERPDEWPFAQGALEVEQDAERCGLRGGRASRPLASAVSAIGASARKLRDAMIGTGAGVRASRPGAER